jgi:hypothetical protein
MRRVRLASVAGGMMELMRLICSASLDLSQVRQQYSAALCTLVDSMLGKEPTSRPSFKQLLANNMLARLAPARPEADVAARGNQAAAVARLPKATAPPKAQQPARSPAPAPPAVRPGARLPPMRTPLALSTGRPSAAPEGGDGGGGEAARNAVAPAKGALLATKADDVAFGADGHAAAAAVQRSFRRRGPVPRHAVAKRRPGLPCAAQLPSPSTAAAAAAEDAHRDARRRAVAMAKINGLLDDARQLRGGPKPAGQPTPPSRPAALETPSAGLQQPQSSATASPALTPELQRRKDELEAERRALAKEREVEEERARQRREEDEARDAERAAKRAAKKAQMMRGY